MGYIEKWTEEKIAALQREGRGSGRGADYQPWIRVSDISSDGKSGRPWSKKTGRKHDVLSDVERAIFFALEWSTEVLDIREQYPLDRELTQDIAREMRVRHPHYPGTHVPTVMTVDFMVTKASAEGATETAINAKCATDAEDESSLVKLEIQRRYFELVGVPHHLIFDTQLPKQKISNIKWIRDALLKDGEFEPRPGYFDEFSRRMAQELLDPRWAELALNEYCELFDDRHSLETGTGLRAVRILMAQRALQVDLAAANLREQPVGSFLMTAQPGALRAVGGR